MATNEAKTVRIPDALFTQLAEPFGPSEIKWRVTHTSHDGTRGAVSHSRIRELTRTVSTSSSLRAAGPGTTTSPRYRP